MGKQSDSRLMNYSMWVLPNFRYPGLSRLTNRASNPHSICKAIAFRHLVISSPDIIEMRSMDAIFFIDRRSHWSVDAIAFCSNYSGI